MYKNILQKLYLMLVIILVSSCKSRQISNDTNNHTKQHNYSKNDFKNTIDEYKKSLPHFNTLQAKLKIESSNFKQTLELRIKKDSVIWLSAPLSIVRTILTPEGIQFYNKLDKTYFDGDYSYVNHIAGYEFSFQEIQKILTGDLIVYNNSDEMRIHDDYTSYDVYTNNGAFKLDKGSVNNESPKLIRQTIHRRNRKAVFINYNTYNQSVGLKSLPQKMTILVGNDNLSTKKIALELQKVVLDKTIRFPFKIPKKFKAIN